MQVARRVAEQPAPVPVQDKFAVLRRATRVWAVAAIHGEVDRLVAVHDALGARFAAGDRLVYLGNYLGRGAAVVATLDELLRFRREIIARPQMFASDVVYLRGSQEEMWQKLLQLQFAVNPRDVLEWMLSHGLSTTLEDYGCDATAGKFAAREGAMAIGRWTNLIRQAVAAHPGHRELMSALKRAAHTEDNSLLLVHAGVDPARPLTQQGDAFWWGHPGWSRLDTVYEGFQRVVRGFDRSGRVRATDGLEDLPHRFTVDGGCGFDGKLIAVCLSASGELVERIDA